MRVSPLVLWAAFAVLAGCGGTSPFVLRQAQDDKAGATHSARAACSGSRIGQAQCDVLIENGGAHSMYAGWSAKDLEAAYDLPSSTKGKGQKVF
ncbi:MAG: hypothetical protein ABSD52_11675, partial [Candidatus Cybelea sp.]